MSVSRVVRSLLEEPENDPLDIGPLERYTGPVAFHTHIRNILDRAEFLKQQAAQVGALRLVQQHRVEDVDRAFLLIAVRQILEREERTPQMIARQLEREMHFIWS